MAKNGKTYSITEAQLEDMIKKASEAGAEAYKKEQSQSTRRKVDRMLYKTKVLLEKYTWLKAYAKNSVYTLEQAEKVNDGMADIEVLTKFGIFDNDKTLHNLKRGVITVNMLMTHVDNMLEVYRENCESSASKTKQRQYRVVYNMYLAEEKKTTKEIAEMDVRRYARSRMSESGQGGLDSPYFWVRWYSGKNTQGVAEKRLHEAIKKRERHTIFVLFTLKPY